MRKYYFNLIISLTMAVPLTICGCNKFRINTLNSMQDQEKICAGREAGQIYIDRSDLDPLNVQQGDDFKHKLDCTFCAPPNVETIQIELTRKIIFNAKVIKENMELQNVNTGENTFEKEIKVPEGANTGIYYLETIIHFDDKTFSHKDRFNVIAR